MKKRLHWRLISMLVVLCMTLQLVPVIAVQAEDHDHIWGEWAEINDGVYERTCSECSDVQTGVRVQYDYITNGGESIDISGTDLKMDGGYAMAIVPMGESVDLSPTASRSDGFEFYGWSEGMFSPVVKDSIEITDTEPILLYAAFKRDTGKTVSFWSKDGQLQGEYEIMEYNGDGFFGAALNGDEELIDMMYMPDRMDGWHAEGWVMDEGADEATYNDSEQIETIEEQYILLNNEDGEGNPIENYYAMYYRELSLAYDVSGYDAVAPSENTFGQYYNSAFGNMSSGDAVLASVTLTDDPVYRWAVDDKLYFPGDTVTLTKTATMEEPSATARLVLESDLLTVTYDTATNGGSGGQVAAKKAANGMKADLTPVAEPYVGAFVGWNTDKDAHEGLTEFIVNEDTTLYAIYKRTEHAEFHHSEESVDYGVTVDVYNNETKAGYIDPVPTPKPYGTLQGWEAFGWSNSTAADDNIVNMEDAFGVPCVPDITKPYYAIHHRELSVTYDTGGHESVGGTPYGNKNIKFDQYHHATGVTSPYTVVSFESLWTEDDDFECWVDGNGNEYTGGENITPTNASVTLTAKWHSDTVYTVTFEDYDGTQINKAAVYPDYKVTAPVEKGRAGYDFEGWFNGSVKFDASAAVTANVTYTAKYTEKPKYTVTFFDYDSTTTEREANYANGYIVSAPDAKGQTGYSFEGWFNEKGEEFDPSAVIGANALYIARYTADPVVTYDYGTNGGTSMTGDSTRPIKTGAKADLSPTAAKAGYSFAGWNTDKDAHEGLTSFTVIEDVTLYAIYKKSGTVTLVNPGGSSSLEAEVYNNENTAYVFETPAPESVDGYTFVGWKDSAQAADGVVSIKDGQDRPCFPAAAAYYALYNRNVTLSYDVGGYYTYKNFSSSAVQYYNAGGAASAPELTVSAVPGLDPEDPDTGNFRCWIDEDGNEYKPGDKITITEDTTLTADWYCVVYYDVISGGWPVSKEFDWVKKGDDVDLSVTVELPEGMKFLGWGEFADDTEPLTSLKAEEDQIELQAIYTEPVKVKFVFPENNVVEKDFIRYNGLSGCVSDEVINPEKPGWELHWVDFPEAEDKFAHGWNGAYVSEDGTSVDDYTLTYYALYERDIDLYYWRRDYAAGSGKSVYVEVDYEHKKQYYNSSGAISEGEFTYTVKGLPEGIDDPSFLYWKDGKGNIYNPGEKITITETTKLTAVYSNDDHTVTYDYLTNGGTSMDGSSSKVTGHGDAADLTPTAEKEGYKFVGWNTDKNAHSAITDYTVTEDITLYAIFERESLVRFYSQPGRPQAMIKAQSFNNETDWTLESVPTPVLPDGWTSLGWTTKTDADGVSGMGPSDDPVTIADPSTSFYAVGSRELLIGYYSDREGDLTDRDGTQYYNGSGTVSWVDFTIIPYPGSETDFAAWGRNGVSGTKYYPDDVFRWSPAPEEDASLTFAAVWKETVVERSVSYDFKTNGGKSASKTSDTVIDGSAADLSPTAAKDGYSFIGWNTDKFAHEALEELMVTDNVTLYAIFAREVTVSFTNGDGSKEERVDRVFNNDADVSVAAPAISPREGWKSYGWRDPSGSSQTIYKNGAVKTGRDISVEAMYTRNVTLTFDMNGAATYVKPQTKLQNSTMADVVFTLPAPPMRDGYTFKGWDVAGNVIPYVYGGFNTVSLNGNTTAKAVWEEIKPAREEVTITYDYRTNGGTGISGAASSTVIKGSDADLTLKAEKTGWDFVGWSTDSGAHEALESIRADSNIVLYAIYKKDVTARFYSGPSKGEPVVINGTMWNNDLSVQIEFPTAAAAGARTFDGWRRDLHPLAANFKGSASISLNTDFYAIYSRSITVDIENESNETSTQYFNTGSGEQPVMFVLPEHTGETIVNGRRFVGYTNKEDGKNYWPSDTITVHNSTNIVSLWVNIPDGASLPEVDTLNASVSSYTSAALSMSVANDDISGNEIISQGFVYWSKNDVASKYTVRTDKMTEELTGLAQGTEYYYYAFAENAAGIGKGTIKSFKTDSDKTPNAILISPEYVALEKGGVYQLLATLLPDTAANREIFWSSSDTSVVTVDSSGKITGVGSGQAIITATTEVGRLTAECIVDVTAKQEAKEYDFSEWHMASHMSSYAGGFDWDTAMDGGNYQMSTAYLARWDGAVLEKDDPYPKYDGNTKTKINGGKNAAMHVQDVEWIPKREGALDNDDIKSALMEYGAVYTTMNVEWGCFTADNVSYFCNYPTDMNSHAITIVGWDDNYPATKFRTKAPGNGAFICKNSWGDSWGEEGYFYISYYDVNLGRKDSNAVFTTAQGADNYNKIYQYDPLGAIGYIGYSETTYAANVFPEEGKTITNDETLKAVSFYTYQKNTTYDVYIVTDYKDKSSLEEIHTPNASGTIKNTGYHTIELKTPVEIKKGTRFAVIVEYDTPGEDAYVYCEYPVGGYSGSARANSGESFMGGDPYWWDDLTDYIPNANFCIKAFTDNGLASVSEVLYSGVDNENREYENDRVFTVDEAVENGFGISSEYVDYAEGRGDTAELMDAPRFNLGNIPSIAKTGLNTVSFTDGAMFPAKYDLREMGLVSSVKNQGEWGTCWAHSTFASLESAMLKKEKTTQNKETASEASEITLSRGDAILGGDAAITLAKKILPLNLSDKSVKWMSSDNKVVTVDSNGTIRSVGEGVASVSVSTNAGGLVAQCSIIVDQGDIPKSVTFESHSHHREVGDKFMIAYSVNPVTDEDDMMTWVSDNTNTAVVSDTGIIEIVGEGSANVSIVSNGEIMDTAAVVCGSGFNLEVAGIDNSEPDSAAVTILNKASSPQSATVMLGIYKNDRLAGTKLITQVFAPGESTVKLDGISSELKEGCTYKCMLWNAASDMTPMSAAMAK